GYGWSPESVAPWTPPLFPWLHVLPNGNVFASGPQPRSYIFNPSNQTWTTSASTQLGQTRSYGPSVLLPLLASNGYKPRVMILGGIDLSTATTEIIDLSVANPAWRYSTSMSVPRTKMNATLLPDGRLIALGGSPNNEQSNNGNRNADLF